MSRVYEAVIILLLVAALVIGTVWVADSLTLHFNTSEENIMVNTLIFIIHFLYVIITIFTIICATIHVYVLL